jgi:hypothetical protein
MPLKQDATHKSPSPTATPQRSFLVASGASMSIGLEYILEMRDSLTMFCDEAAKLIQRHGSLPVAGSQAENEKATFARPQSVVNAWSPGTQLIEFDGGHVSAFV